ncbi:hypothetical protein [Streptomyces sp. ODS28]|uniref:hypothetical protein n=1 Tax=Streptomyces sp. ODS28 TaxID=3136688 RepID=UPI0031EAB8CC
MSADHDGDAAPGEATAPAGEAGPAAGAAPAEGIASAERPARRRRLLPAFALLLLAPLVGEFLLGNQPVTDLGAVLLFLPLYGCGALLVRETARRAGRGWPTMVLLAAAYALIEEGPVDQMLWNPHYGGVDMGAVYAATHIPGLGTSVEMLQDVLAMHTVWSICVPIALVETFTREPTRPWLRLPGVAVTGAVFVAGSVFLAVQQAVSEGFVASPAQFTQAGVVIVGLIVLGFAVGRRQRAPFSGSSDSSGSSEGRPAPNPWLVGAVALVVSSLYWTRQEMPEGPAWKWALCAVWCVLAAGFVALVLRWSARPGWGAAHRLALAGGALLTYVWVGFTQAAELDVPRAVALAGNAVFGAGALLLLALAVRSLRSRGRSSAGRPGRGERAAPVA